MSLNSITFSIPSTSETLQPDLNLLPDEALVSQIADVNLTLDPILRYGSGSSKSPSVSSSEIGEDERFSIASSTMTAQKARETSEAVVFAASICNAASFEVKSGTLMLTSQRIVFAAPNVSKETSRSLKSLEVPIKDLRRSKIVNPWLGKAHWRGEIIPTKDGGLSDAMNCEIRFYFHKSGMGDSAGSTLKEFDNAIQRVKGELRKPKLSDSYDGQRISFSKQNSERSLS